MALLSSFQTAARRRAASFLVVLLLTGLTTLGWTSRVTMSVYFTGSSKPPSGLVVPMALGKTLVIYVYGGSDPEYVENFQYFVEEAVKADDGCEYLIVLQQGGGTVQPEPLPALPPNARYLLHPNHCLDLGTVGWVLEHHVSHLDSFHYFVWANPSVRGPFMPAYLRGRMHWTEPFLSKITPLVKLVGATVSCELAAQHGAPVHVQSYIAATDRKGLAVLLRTGTVFQCYDDLLKTIVESEIGASIAILAAGYSVDSLMLRYQGVDWRDPAVQHRPCNAGLNPLSNNGANDGMNVDPLEVMFVKVKKPMRSWPHVAAAIKFSHWTRLANEQARRATAGLRPRDAWLDAVAANSWNPN